MKDGQKQYRILRIDEPDLAVKDVMTGKRRMMRSRW